jgi:hypothetical protein
VLIHKGSKTYVYISKRKGRRVDRFYAGPADSELAQLTQAQLQLSQARREQERAEWLALLEDLQPRDRALGALHKDLALVAKACLLHGGFYQHDQSTWRTRPVTRRSRRS